MTEGGRPDQNPVSERSHRTLKYQFLNCRDKLPAEVKYTRDLQFIIDLIKTSLNNDDLLKTIIFLYAFNFNK